MTVYFCGGENTYKKFFYVIIYFKFAILCKHNTNNMVLKN